MTKKAISIDADNLEDAIDAIKDVAKRAVLITGAQIKDACCNYSYEINTGPTSGDKINRKGGLIIHQDMQDAFEKLNIHLAILDDAFSTLPKPPKTLQDMLAHPIAGNFRVIGFKVQGTDENKGYILIGEKTVSHGVIALESPKITKFSEYDQFDDLHEAQ